MAQAWSRIGHKTNRGSKQWRDDNPVQGIDDSYPHWQAHADVAGHV